MATDSVAEAIATLTGKKAEDFTPEHGPSVVTNWRFALIDAGYKTEMHRPQDVPKDRHVVFYSDSAGTTQAVLSDSDEAKRVKPISRMTVTKTKEAKAA